MIAIVLEAALRGMGLAAIVGLGLSLLRVSNVPMRKAAWTLVLLASLAMPALMRWPALTRLTGPFAWSIPVPATHRAAPLPTPEPLVVTPAISYTAATSAVQQTDSAATTPIVAVDLTEPAPVASNAPAVLVTPRRQFHWPPLQQTLAWIYLAVSGALLLRLFIGLAVALRLWSKAEPVSPLIAPEPHVRVSSGITSPVTIGSGIVLPADFLGWDRQKLRMVLAHEQSHVRQLDFYLQLLAGLYTAIFWFSPLGWYLRSTLSSLGEAIGDRAGLEAAANRTHYAQVVLEFAAMPRQSLPGVAMARSGNLARRVESMLDESHLRRAFAEGRRRALASLLLIPAALFAVTALVRVSSAEAQTAPPSAQQVQQQTQSPDQPPRTGQSMPDQPESQVTTTDVAPAAAQPQAVPATPPSSPDIPPPPPPGPAPTAAPNPAAAPPDADAPVAPPMPPVPPASADDSAAAILDDGRSVTLHNHHAFLIDDGQSVNGNGFHFSSNGDSYALIHGPDSNITFSGNWSSDVNAQIEKARHMTSGPFLWFTHKGKSYIVTDPAIIAQIQSMYRPMDALGAQQRALGKQQEALGKQQDALRLGSDRTIVIHMPDLSKEMADMNASLAQMKTDQFKLDEKNFADMEASLKAAEGQMLTPEKLAEIQKQIAEVQKQWTPARLADLQAKIASMQGRLGELQGEAGMKAGELGEKMGALGEQQGKLGEEQGRIGEQQGKLAQDLDKQVQKVIQETLQNGKAKPLQ